MPGWHECAEPRSPDAGGGRGQRRSVCDAFYRTCNVLLCLTDFLQLSGDAQPPALSWLRLPTLLLLTLGCPRVWVQCASAGPCGQHARAPVAVTGRSPSCTGESDRSRAVGPLEPRGCFGALHDRCTHAPTAASACGRPGCPWCRSPPSFPLPRSGARCSCSVHSRTQDGRSAGGASPRAGRQCASHSFGKRAESRASTK